MRLHRTIWILGWIIVLGNPGCVWNAKTYSRIVLITLDAARWDFFPRICGNRGRHPTSLPALERLCRESLVFTRAYTPVPNTPSAMASLYTGYFPLHHLVLMKQPMLPQGFDTLAEVLRDPGFHTMVISGNSGYFMPETHFVQGFEVIGHLEPGVHYSNPDFLVSRLLEHLPTLCRRRCFVHIHFVQPHSPYGAPARFFRKPIPGDMSLISTDFVARYAHERRLAAQVPRKTYLDILEHYRAGLRWADAAIGRLLDFIDSRPWGRDTLVIVTADHGEAFGEHKEWLHNTTPFEEMVHIPMIVRTRSRRHAVRNELVALEDLYATILHAAGVRDVDIPFGSIPIALDTSTPSARHRVFLLTMGRRYTEPIAVVYRHYKYIYERRPNWSVLYDLARDPDETENIIYTQYRLAQQMHRLMWAYLHALMPPDRLPETGVIRRAGTLEQKSAQLRALGYVGVRLAWPRPKFDLYPAPIPPDQVTMGWSMALRYEPTDSGAEEAHLIVHVQNRSRRAWSHRTRLERYGVAVECIGTGPREFSVRRPLTRDVYPGQSVGIVESMGHLPPGEYTISCRLVQDGRILGTIQGKRRLMRPGTSSGERTTAP